MAVKVNQDDLDTGSGVVGDRTGLHRPSRLGILALYESVEQPLHYLHQGMDANVCGFKYKTRKAIAEFPST